MRPGARSKACRSAADWQPCFEYRSYSASAETRWCVETHWQPSATDLHAKNVFIFCVFLVIHCMKTLCASRVSGQNTSFKQMITHVPISAHQAESHIPQEVMHSYIICFCKRAQWRPPTAHLFLITEIHLRKYCNLLTAASFQRGGYRRGDACQSLDSRSLVAHQQERPPSAGSATGLPCAPNPTMCLIQFSWRGRGCWLETLLFVPCPSPTVWLCVGFSLTEGASVHRTRRLSSRVAPHHFSTLLHFVRFMAETQKGRERRCHQSQT